MSDFDIDQFTSALSMCLVANTPAFVFSRLKEDSAVLELGERLSESEHRDLIDYWAKDARTSLESRFRFYIVLVATLSKTFSEFSRIINGIDLSSVPWGSDLAQMIGASLPAITIDTVHCKQTPQIASFSWSEDNEQSRGLTYDSRPRIIL